MKLFTGLCVVVVALFLTLCVVAQERGEVDLAKLHADLDKETSFTSKWLGGPRHVWYLGFKHEKIRPIRLSWEEGEIELYYYMLYTITNKDERDREIEIRIGAWSDKQPCPNKWDETLKRYRQMSDLKYRDTYLPEKENLDIIKKIEKKRLDVIKKIEKKHFLKEANNGEGLYSLAKVTIPEELGKATDTGTHGDETGINSPVIKAGETWQCVAVFKKISTEMDYLRIYVSGLTNDFQILTNLDTDKVREYRGSDMVLMKNGEMIRCRAEERLNDVRMFIRNVAGMLDERIEKLVDVQEISKSRHARIKQNQRLIVEKVLEITYERLGDEFYVSNDWMQKIGQRSFEWIRVIDCDLPHEPVDIDNPPGAGPGP
jgi:hypothetical protein